MTEFSVLLCPVWKPTKDKSPEWEISASELPPSLMKKKNLFLQLTNKVYKTFSNYIFSHIYINILKVKSNTHTPIGNFELCQI